MSTNALWNKNLPQVTAVLRLVFQVTLNLIKRVYDASQGGKGFAVCKGWLDRVSEKRKELGGRQEY